MIFSTPPPSLQSALEVSIWSEPVLQPRAGSDLIHTYPVHFVAAAGNSAADAGTMSPASEQSIVTVGAVDRTNKMASFSNFGQVVDIFALGVDVQAAWIGSPQATRFLSGTSMSSPAVAGTLAVEISKYGQASPANLEDSLKKNAKPVVTGQPEGTT